MAQKPDALKFAQQIIAEFDTKKRPYPTTPALSLYFGGGTPSLLNPSAIGQIIAHLRKQNALEHDAEITIEANPENINPDYASRLKQAGVNRVSIGVQSFDDKILRFLSRGHSSNMAKQAVLDLQKAEISNIVIDQIIGVPGESMQIINNGLVWAKENAINHISAYMLTLKETSTLMSMVKKNKCPDIDDDYQAQSYTRIQQQLSKLGFEQYEISNFAQVGAQAVHNRLYWASSSYLGLGPGAHSMLLKEDRKVQRSANVKNLALWQQNPISSQSFCDNLPNHEALLEAAAFGIRDMDQGIDPRKLSQKFNCAMPQGFSSIMNSFQESDLVKEQAGIFRLTAKGALFADQVSREILALR